MKNSKLIPILKTFSSQDWKEFRKWYRTVGEKDSKGEILFSKIAGIKNWEIIRSNAQIIDILLADNSLKGTKGTLANSLTKFTEHVDDFLVSKQIKSSIHLRNSILLNSYAQRGLNDLHNVHIDILTPNERIQFWDNYHGIKSSFNAYYKGFYKNYQDSKKGLELLTKHILNFTKDISDFVSVEMTNRSIVLGEDWSEQIYSLKNANMATTEYSKIFEQVELMRSKNDKEAYKYITNVIRKLNDLPEEIVEILMVHLTSYLNLRFKKGEFQLADDVLALYELGVQNGYYLSDGKMSPRRFLNIVNTACSLEKEDWADTFTHQYSNLLETKFKSNIVLLSQAAISFARGDFENVSKLLHTHRFNDFDLEYRARLLKLQSNIEIEKDNPSYIQDEIRSFKYYLKRNTSKLNTATLVGTQNLLKYIERLLEGKMKDIKEDLAKEKYIMLGRWLNKTIEQKLKDS